MNDKEIARVLGNFGLPEARTQALIKNVLYVLPVGSISSGVCLNRSSNPLDCRLVVFQQPLYIPFEGVAFWKATHIRSEEGEAWPFDPDPDALASVTLVRAIKQQCLPIAQKRLTAEEALQESIERLKKSPLALRLRADRVYSLCELERIDEALFHLGPLMETLDQCMRIPRQRGGSFDWNLEQDRASAQTLAPQLTSLQRALTSSDAATQVRKLLAFIIETTKRNVGLSGIP